MPSRRGTTNTGSDFASSKLGRSSTAPTSSSSSKPLARSSTHHSSSSRSDSSNSRDGRKTSLAQKIAPPNPLPQASDPEERAERKKMEKEVGGFTWEHAAELALLGLFTAFSVERTLEKTDKQKEKEEKGKKEKGGKTKKMNQDRSMGRDKGRRERRDGYREAGRSVPERPRERHGYGFRDDRYRLDDGHRYDDEMYRYGPGRDRRDADYGRYRRREGPPMSGGGRRLRRGETW